MAKIGCLKPFRGSWNSMKDYVLEDGEIAFTTDNKRVYMGNGIDTISNLTPYINNGNTDISNIGDGSITGAINTINSKITQTTITFTTSRTTAYKQLYTLPIPHGKLAMIYVCADCNDTGVEKILFSEDLAQEDYRVYAKTEGSRNCSAVVSANAAYPTADMQVYIYAAYKSAVISYPDAIIQITYVIL